MRFPGKALEILAREGREPDSLRAGGHRILQNEEKY
jgi:hypothetical protein